MKSIDFAALIPLRGGSKSIKDKNIKPFFNKPLCYWALEAAFNSSEIDEVFVSTDSERIKEIVTELNNNIIVVDRPKSLATDTSSTEDVMLHFSEKYEFENLVTIQATSPMLSSEDLNQAIKKYKKFGFDSLFSAVRTKRFFWDEKSIQPINYDFKNRPRRQDFDGIMMENGSFYITHKEILDNSRSRLDGNIGFYEMSEEHSIELDEPMDWIILEQIARDRSSI